MSVNNIEVALNKNNSDYKHRNKENVPSQAGLNNHYSNKPYSDKSSTEIHKSNKNSVIPPSLQLILEGLPNDGNPNDGNSSNFIETLRRCREKESRQFEYNQRVREASLRALNLSQKQKLLSNMIKDCEKDAYSYSQIDLMNYVASFLETSNISPETCTTSEWADWNFVLSTIFDSTNQNSTSKLISPPKLPFTNKKITPNLITPEKVKEFSPSSNYSNQSIESKHSDASNDYSKFRLSQIPDWEDWIVDDLNDLTSLSLNERILCPTINIQYDADNQWMMQQRDVNEVDFDVDSGNYCGQRGVKSRTSRTGILNIFNSDDHNVTSDNGSGINKNSGIRGSGKDSSGPQPPMGCSFWSGLFMCR